MTEPSLLDSPETHAAVGTIYRTKKKRTKTHQRKLKRRITWTLSKTR